MKVNPKPNIRSQWKQSRSRVSRPEKPIRTNGESRWRDELVELDGQKFPSIEDAAGVLAEKVGKTVGIPKERLKGFRDLIQILVLSDPDLERILRGNLN